MLGNIFTLLLQVDFLEADILVPVVWIVGVWMLLKYGLICWALWNLKARDHTETPIGVEELHPEVRRQLQPWLKRLDELGFGGSNLYHIDALAGLERVLWRVTHPEFLTVAELRILILPTGAAPRVTLSFYNFLNDGRFLVTAEPGSCDHVPTHWIGLFSRFKSIGGQWETHQLRLKELPAAAIAPTDLASAMAAQLAATDQASVDAGLMERDPHDATGWRVRRIRIPWSALKSLKLSLPGFKMGAALRSDLAPPAPAQAGVATQILLTTDADDLVERDLKKYHQAIGGKKGLGRWAKLALLTVTLGLFAVFWQGGDLGETTGVIIGVLLLHEFGHWLPMKLFGYQNVTMFFIPGFGAAVSGKKQHAPAWQDLVVLLGGPLPGLIGGIAVMIAGYFRQDIPDYLLNAASLSVIINALNLLPFLPLDGGKIVDLLIFRDVPLLRLLFNGFSTLVVLGACFLPGMGVLRFMAILMVLGLIRDMKMFGIAKEARKVAWAGQVEDEDTALRRIFKELREAGNAHFVGSQDWLMRTQVVVEEVLRKRPSWPERLPGLGVYGAVSLIPVALIATVVAVQFSGIFSKSVGELKYLSELREDLPASSSQLSEGQMTPLDKLATATATLLSDVDDELTEAERIPQTAKAMSEEMGREIDLLKWEEVGAFENLGYSSAETVDIWLEAACLRLEKASEGSKSDEAPRRAEIVLHALRSLEPASSYRQCKQLAEVQIRVLKCIAKLNGSGAITQEMQDRLKPRIQALRNLPDPAVEAFLVVDGWTDEHMQRLSNGDEATESESDDATFCRMFYQQIDDLRNRQRALPSASLAVARFWKKDGKAEELPAEAPGGVRATAAEAGFLHRFCERRREVVWHQNAVLYAMNLDAYQKQHGRHPVRWDHEVPGGGRVDFIPGAVPAIRLTDARNEAQRAGPAWLGRRPDALQPAVDFPLRPVVDRAGIRPF